MSLLNNQKYSTPVIKLNQPDDSDNIQPLPAPSGTYPYHLNANSIIQLNDDKLIFHMVGDTGGTVSPAFQKKIASEMTRQYTDLASAGERPMFLYHLGDVVYHHGEANNYDRQFFTPYRNYPSPIFAIAGNHDSDVNPYADVPYSSLAAFKAVFCDSSRRKISFSGSTEWKSMPQPNIYWTLETPLASIIGLHSNVPKYGFIGKEQRAWFVQELVSAGKLRPEKAIIVCLHHAPYSADFNHSSSIPMITFLEDAFEKSQVRPDIVFSGHVHNYQRFHKNYPNGKILPFIVSGGGGFDELHALAPTDSRLYTADYPLLQNVKLESYCDAQHGFLKITLKRLSSGILLTGEYYAVPHKIENEDVASLVDVFSYKL